MTRTLKTTCFQLSLEKQDNYDLVKEKILNFHQTNDKTDLYVLSELCVGGPGADKSEYYLEKYLSKFQEIASDLGIWIIPGTFYEKVDNKIFNVAPVINSSGSLVTKAKKIFPWLPYEKGVESGDDVCVFEMPNIGKIGVQICYDLWFPEISRMQALNGAELIINPTLTPTKDREIETVMARAVAAQQQLFYLDVNSCGDQGCGKSIVCDYNGEVVHESKGSEDIFTVELSLEDARESRKNGIYDLGQPLKSFRDHKIFSELYDSKNLGYLASLGPLQEKNKDKK